MRRKTALRADEEKVVHDDGVVRVARLKEADERATAVASAFLGLDAFLPSRTFTREEVLTVLHALKADTGVVAGREALDRAVRVFERME